APPRAARRPRPASPGARRVPRAGPGQRQDHAHSSSSRKMKKTTIPPVLHGMCILGRSLRTPTTSRRTSSPRTIKPSHEPLMALATFRRDRGGGGYRPMERPTTSFSISVVLPKIDWIRASCQAFATGYSIMYPYLLCCCRHRSITLLASPEHHHLALA